MTDWIQRACEWSGLPYHTDCSPPISTIHGSDENYESLLNSNHFKLSWKLLSWIYYCFENSKQILWNFKTVFQSACHAQKLSRPSLSQPLSVRTYLHSALLWLPWTHGLICSVHATDFHTSGRHLRTSVNIGHVSGLSLTDYGLPLTDYLLNRNHAFKNK